ncbi:hypothetical protein B0H14DRAFT_3069208 [Mycena olivaceomarginata]|nr:hypothetical protein B0H14DRAFT_3069208 [Mycena olivaceomarginata]
MVFKMFLLAAFGRKEIEIAEVQLPGLMYLRKKYGPSQPLKGARIAGCLHMTIQTAVLIETLTNLGGQEGHLIIAATGVPVFAWKGETEEEYTLGVFEQTIAGFAAASPLNMILTMEAISSTEIVHESTPILSGTTPAWHHLYNAFVTAAQDSPAHQTSRTRSPVPSSTLLTAAAESLVDGIKRATDVMLAGKVAVVAGFGDVGKGCAESLRSYGARVLVTEIDPINALQAAMAGYEVTTMEDAATQHFLVMPEDAIVCNIGHFDVEIDVAWLKGQRRVRRHVKPQVDRFTMPSGRHIILLAEGRSRQLGMRHRPPVLAQIALWTTPEKFPLGELDEEVARAHLAQLNVKLTVLSDSQAKYLDLPPNGPYSPTTTATRWSVVIRRPQRALAKQTGIFNVLTLYLRGCRVVSFCRDRTETVF